MTNILSTPTANSHLCDTPRCSSRTVLTYCDHRQAALFYALTYRKRHALRVEEYNGNDVGSWVLLEAVDRDAGPSDGTQSLAVPVGLGPNSAPQSLSCRLGVKKNP